jgi:hypothetical protein
MNFSVTALLIWTRYHSVHVFPILHIRGRSFHGDEIVVRLDLPYPISYSEEIIKAGNASAHCSHAGCNRKFILIVESLIPTRFISEWFYGLDEIFTPCFPRDLVRCSSISITGTGQIFAGDSPVFLAL